MEHMVNGKAKPLLRRQLLTAVDTGICSICDPGSLSKQRAQIENCHPDNVPDRTQSCQKDNYFPHCSLLDLDGIPPKSQNQLRVVTVCTGESLSVSVQSD